MPVCELHHNVFLYLLIRVPRRVDSYPGLGILAIDLCGRHKHNLVLACVEFIANDYLVAVPRECLSCFGNEQRGIGLELQAI